MSELFSEVYGCYFQVIKSLISQKSSISEQELHTFIQNNCFEESILYLLPKLQENEWGFYQKQDGLLHTKLSADFHVPLTNLQKSYLKAILADEKIRLFLSDAEITELNHYFAGIPPLFTPADFYYYDRFLDKDNYADPDYRKHFQMILTAIENRETLTIYYESRQHHRVCHHYLPCRLEYSMKNDCFRLIAVKSDSKRHTKTEIINLNRIKSIAPDRKKAELSSDFDIDKLLRRSCYREPVRILIKDRRNALERAMLQFANYEKSTKRLDDSTYECRIYYNKNTETELLIEILSFGPMIKVVGNEKFLSLIKERLLRQEALNRRS